MVITKQFLKDLRTADSLIIVFKGELSDIDLLFRNKNRVTERRISYDYHDTTNVRGVWQIFLFPDQNTTEKTIFSLLRVGDKLRFTVRRNGNQYTQQAGLNVIDLMLDVIRYKKDGKTIAKCLQFELAKQICPTNSAINITQGIELVAT
jgi:hypothetical protein